ncbi:glutamate receptor ionotropic, kainate 2-like isoform X1 [Tribolium castaneum]
MRCLGLTVFLLIFPNFLGQEQDRKEIFLGGIFTEPPDVDDSVLSDEEAFNFAIDIANREYSDVKFTSVSEESDLRTNGPFDSRLQACSLVNQQALVIFGPKNAEEIDIVQSICDNKDLAHVITRWVYSSADFRSVINFYPHSAYLTSAYFSVLKLWNWKTLTVFYEDNESMLRLGDLLNLAKNEGIIVTVKQLYEGLDETPIYRTTLKEAVRSGQKNFIIDCKIESLEEVLKQAQQVGLMTKDYNFFITNLDLQTINLEPFQYSEANITGIRILDPLNEMFHVKAGAIMRQKPNFNLTKMRTETALLIDAVSVITQVISRKLSIKEMEMTEISCNSPKSSRHGYTIANHVKTSKFDEMTGRIEFDGNGVRSNFDLDVIELTQNGISKIGTWNMSKGLVITPHKDEDIVEDPLSLRNKTFKVITCLTDPYCMLKENSGQLFGNDRFEGFAIDLIHELAQMEGFNYTFIIREDKSNGDKNKVTGEWSGMIGDVMHGVADLAITDLTITAEREEAVDFTSPFMNLGISILAKKPGNAPPSFFSFADPFALDTWIMLALAYIAVSVSFFVLGRICPDEWTNPYPCVEEPEFLINQFSLSNSFWYAVGSLMQQGTELAPIGVPTRMVAGMWWFFVLIMVSSYTASLAAFLANENTITLFTDVESLVQNYEEKGIRMGAKRKGATEGFFRGKDSETYKIIAKYMEEHPDDMVGDNKDGVKLANKETYAFFMESISIEYETQRHCDLQQYGGLLDDKGYGIAMRKNSTYRKTLSTAILKLQSSGQLDNLKRTWWEEKRGGGQCLDSGDDATPALDVRNVEGVFYVTIGGTLCAIVLIFFELFLSLLKISKKYKISMREALNNEKKAFLDFNSNVKPAPKAKSKSGSKSSGESGKSNNNTGAPTYGFIPTITKDTLDE